MGPSRPGLMLTGALALLLLAWTAAFSPAPIVKDANDNLRMGYSLARSGTISLDVAPPYAPTMRREPLPALATALVIRTVEAVAGPAPLEDYAQGPRARWIKLQNLFWLAAMTAGVFAATRRLTGRTAPALAACALANLVMLAGRGALVDTLYSDLAAGALLVWMSLLLTHAWRASLRAAAAAGVGMGLLILTKATFLYIFAGLVLALALLALWRTRGRPGWPAARRLALFAAVTLALTLPWMARNHAAFDTAQVADRGGRVLMLRAYKDMMTPTEYRGAFYVWAPRPLQPAVGAVLGFSPRDLEIGGSLQRLNRDARGRFRELDLEAAQQGRPDLALSFFRQTTARATQIRKRLEGEGRPDAARLTEAAITREATGIILAHPWRHLALTLPLLWRGGCFAMVFLAAAMVFALARRRDELAVFLLPAVGLGAFMALFTHFIPRYAWPAIPVIAVCLAVAAVEAWRRRRRSP